MAAGAVHVDELDVIAHDNTVTEYRGGVHYTLRTAGLTTCTIIDPTTGHTITQHHDILRTDARKATP